MSLTSVLLGSGRSLDLTELRLSSTYGGLLEGYPFKLLNDRKIQGFVNLAAEEFTRTPVHLVPPPRTHPDGPAGPFGPMELLPAVACTGTFRSTPVDPGHDPVLYRSALTVVWFQPTPQVPSGREADAALRALAWEELARDSEV
ncbi:hypothetical protein ACIHEJ_29050 [Streptomyces sp. NPDC052301]|uniref:hypothetical protein n=1 Tax=Streptomyces sp. NPDC052301 TaxID=3365687 RepID=UPI0037D820FD